MANENLAIYLNDHLAGSVAAIELIEHLIINAPELAAYLRELKTDIEADQQELKRLIARFGEEESTVRKAAAWLAEKGARVKLAVDGPANSALGKMQALEALYLGITGKLGLWRGLAAAIGAVEGFDWEVLIRRAEQQREGVDERRIQAARVALG